MSGEGEGEFGGVLEGVLEAEPPAGGVVDVAVEVAGMVSSAGAAVLVRNGVCELLGDWQALGERDCVGVVDCVTV